MGHPGLHGFEKARDATTNFSILASQFHGCGHQQASAPPLGTGRAVHVAGKVGPQAVDRLCGREWDWIERVSPFATVGVANGPS